MTTLTDTPPAPTGARPPRVIAVDPSIAGMAAADNQSGQIETFCFPTAPEKKAKGAPKKKKKDHGDYVDLQGRMVYVVGRVADVVADGPLPTLITMEGPSYGSTGSALHEIGGLWWRTYDMLTGFGVPIMVLPPSNVKKYATGNSSATKADMRVALLKRAGVDERNDNRVDAWWICAATLDHLGYPPVPVPKAQREAIESVTWPPVTARR